jgi:multiple sugar transport system substrate-binding protein
MKKILSILTILIIGFTLIACNNDDENPDDNVQKIALTYADWGNADFNRLLIDAFMEKYPHIDVRLSTEIEGTGDAFTGNLITAAQAGILPDVFASDNVPTAVNAGLAMDVATLWDNDPEAQMVYENIAATAVYNGKRLAMPSFQFLKGIFINLSIFERVNLTTNDLYRIDLDGYPVKDWTFDEFVEIAKAVKNFDLINPDNIIIGMDTWYGSPDFQQVWPTMYDAEVGYDTWDGTQFNYTSENWISAMQTKLATHLLMDGTTTNIDPEIVEEIEQLQGYLPETGRAAMNIDGSWQFWLMNAAEENGFEMGFWPYPQGPAGFYPPTILDYILVSSQTEHPEEAYLLAKWMTWGRDGWLARLDIYEQNKADAIAAGEVPVYLDRYPIADFDGVWDRVYGLVDGIKGIEYTFQNIQNAKPDLDKWLPGYKDLWAWINNPENPFNWVALVEAGPDSVPTFALEWQNQANLIIEQEMARLGNEE